MTYPSKNPYESWELALSLIKGEARLIRFQKVDSPENMIQKAEELIQRTKKLVEEDEIAINLLTKAREYHEILKEREEMICKQTIITSFLDGLNDISHSYDGNGSFSHKLPEDAQEDWQILQLFLKENKNSKLVDSLICLLHQLNSEVLFLNMPILPIRQKK